MSPTLYPLVLDRDTISSTLTAINVNALAIHHPGRDGLCLVCAERLCAIRLAAVKAVRAAGVKVPVLPPHPPRRPQWDCELCDSPWPCSQARVMLADEYESDWLSLSARMAALMVQAREELPHASEAELHVRFLAWCWRG